MENNTISVAKPMLRRAANVIDLLVERAKCDKKGVYWPAPPAFRQRPATQMESTLAAGTPGIVLALAEYYRISRDKTISELIAKAASWLDTRVQTRGSTPGFYFGDGGWWYTKTILQEALSDLQLSPIDGSVEAVQKLIAALATRRVAALTDGSAGTLVGLLSSRLRNGDPDLTVLESSLAALIQRARFSPEGIFWDFYPHAVRAPNGFISGSAGVDYAFAGAKRVLGIRYPELVASSVRHANTSYDSKTFNWPDYEAAELNRRIGDDGYTKIVLRAKGRQVKEATLVEDCLGWGNGASGILLSRAAVADAFPDHLLGKMCLADCRQVIARLDRTTDDELTGLTPFILNGLAGIALAAKAYQSCAVSLECPLPAELEEKLHAELERRSEAIGTEDLSMLTGAAGIAYTWLKLGSTNPEDSCINPLYREAITAESCFDHVENLETLIEHRFPRVTAIAAEGNQLKSVGISLTAIDQATSVYRAKHPETLGVRAANYELELHKQLNEITSFRHYYFRESYKRMQYEQLYGDGMNDTLVMERFKLDDEAVSLMELDFDPYQPIQDLKAQNTLLIRHRGSHGIRDVKLSSLQFGLLNQFRSPRIVIEAISSLTVRVQTPNVTQRQLAELALKNVRSFVESGFLISESASVIYARFNRIRFRRTKNNLFPPEVAK